ncbi:hypothetical protein Tco_0262004 [Tanacetum coccineum]
MAVHYSSVLSLSLIIKLSYVDNDHFKEKSSGSTTTHADFSQYNSFIFESSNDQFPPADRMIIIEEFTDELTMTNLLSSLMLYGSFLLFSRIPLSLHIFSPPGMKIPLFDPASHVSFFFYAGFPGLLNDSRAFIIHKSFTSSASDWESSIP